MGTMGTLSLMPLSHKCFRIVPAMKLLGTVFGGIDGGPPLFTLLQPEMPTAGARSGRPDQPRRVGIVKPSRGFLFPASMWLARRLHFLKVQQRI